LLKIGQKLKGVEKNRGARKGILAYRNITLGGERGIP